MLHAHGCKCARCNKGVDFYKSDLHHTNPYNKRFTLDQRTMKSILDGEGEKNGLKKLWNEFKKTILLCRPCHKEVHKNHELDYFDAAYHDELKRR